MLFYYRSPCEFCGVEHKHNCDFVFPADCKNLDHMIHKAGKRDFILVVQLKADVDVSKLEYATVK